MSTNEVVTEFRCRACGGRVQKHYNHVGDCATGRCSGTFEHVQPLARPCSSAYRDIGHGQVTSSAVIVSKLDCKLDCTCASDCRTCVRHPYRHEGPNGAQRSRADYSPEKRLTTTILEHMTGRHAR